MQAVSYFLIFFFSGVLISEAIPIFNPTISTADNIIIVDSEVGEVSTTTGIPESSVAIVESDKESTTPAAPSSRVKRQFGGCGCCCNQGCGCCAPRCCQTCTNVNICSCSRPCGCGCGCGGSCCAPRPCCGCCPPQPINIQVNPINCCCQPRCGCCQPRCGCGCGCGGNYGFGGFDGYRRRRSLAGLQKELQENPQKFFQKN